MGKVLPKKLKRIDRQEFAYCQMSKRKFVVMRRMIATDDVWTRWADCELEGAAKRIVKTMNDNPERLFSNTALSSK
jgi:hypothetical protein